MSRALAAAALLLLLPAASASTATLAFGDGFRTATLHAEAQLDGPQSAILRRQMDLYGNQDGNVSASESRNFLANAQSFIGALVARSVTGGNLTLDGNGPTTTTVQSLAAAGAEGSVDAQDPIDVSLNLTMLFATTDASTHELHAVGHPTPGGDLTMTLVAPVGWRITASQGGLDPSTDVDGASVTFGMPTDGTPLSFTFAATQTKGGPALGVGTVALALGLLAVLAPLRRRDPA